MIWMGVVSAADSVSHDLKLSWEQGGCRAVEQLSSYCANLDPTFMASNFLLGLLTWKRLNDTCSSHNVMLSFFSAKGDKMETKTPYVA